LDESSFATHVLDVVCGLGGALGAPAELHMLYVIGTVRPDGISAATPIVTPAELLEGGRTLLDRITTYTRGWR
jgi:hypothetical protein